jgi:diguanylate cyclase (GGDEF)-like protein
MNKSGQTNITDAIWGWRPDIVYAALLLGAAIATLLMVTGNAGFMAGEHGWGIAIFFLLFGLLTIFAGFPHPEFGHVSFDRVAQVASILVLGPIDAAWVNGLASLLYPWHRLRLGVPLPTVVMASMHNAGLMIFVVLGAGLLYQYLGGVIPVSELDASAAALLLALVVAMQVINDAGMMIILYLRRGNPRLVFNRFTTTVECVSAAAGIVLGIAYCSRTMPYFVLLLLVLVAGMLVIMQYARMRLRLERLVEERTEEIRVQAEEFERQATHDKLTGLPNRRHADTYLKQQIELARRSDRYGALALADVDHFKRINDDHSHAVGDLVLERVARLLSDGCRTTDFVARYGGEEFLLYFPDTQAELALQVCGQLRQAVQDADWSDIVPGLVVTISFGLAETADAERAGVVLDEADKRLYRAKHLGRNRVIAA